MDDGNEFGALQIFPNHLVVLTINFWLLSFSGTEFHSQLLIQSYLTKTNQRIKINNSFGRRSSIEYGIPQGSVLGQLLFTIDLIDLFYECKDSNIADYANSICLWRRYTDCNIKITIISFWIVQIVWKQPNESQPRKASYFPK